MIKVGTLLNVIDNSGVKTAYCIKLNPYKKKSSLVGDIITVVVDKLRKSKKHLKVNRSEIMLALIVRSKYPQFRYSSEKFCFYENSIILLNKKKKLIGTRIFGCLSKNFRKTKFLRSACLSNAWV